ncbi:MAG: response regulator, partial [Mariprofundus sp.]
GEGSTFTVTLPFEIVRQDKSSRHLANTRILLLGHTLLSERVLPSLRRWGAEPDMIHDESLLFSFLVNAWTTGKAYDLLIVEKASLKCTPERLAEAIRPKEELANLELILIDADADNSSDSQRLAAGYSTVLHMPVDESLLFNALHASTVMHQPDQGVIAMVQPHTSHSAMHILLAEDNPINQDVIMTILEKAGHHVQLVEDGEQALDALTNGQTYDLVLLDMHMPHLDGLEVLKQFRFMDTSATTPVIMLSADALLETVHECLAAGADDYLTKPVDVTAMLQTISRYAPTAEPNAAPASTGSATEASDDAILDHSVLDELVWVMSTREKFDKIFTTFARSCQSRIETLEMHAANQDTARYLIEIHTLKGGASVLGAKQITGTCLEAEALKNALDQQAMHTINKQLQMQLTDAIGALRAYMQMRWP